MPANALSAFVQGFIVLVHNNKDPSDEEWQAYLKILEHVPHARGLFGRTLGGKPSSAQRKQSIEIGRNMLAGRQPPHVAIMTNSRAARAVVTIMNWFFNN